MVMRCGCDDRRYYGRFGGAVFVRVISRTRWGCVADVTTMILPDVRLRQTAVQGYVKMAAHEHASFVFHVLCFFLQFSPFNTHETTPSS